jgi:tetratricopeptide (TPR) repeat protein
MFDNVDSPKSPRMSLEEQLEAKAALEAAFAGLNDEKFHDYEEKIDTISGIIERYPFYTPAYYERALEYRSLSGDAFQDIHDGYGTEEDYFAVCDKAIADFTRVVELDYGYIDAYLNRALSHADKQDYAAAIGDYSAAITLMPQNPQFYNQRGAYRTIIGSYDDAFDDFCTAIGLEPNLWSAYENRGFVYYMRGDYEQAVVDFSEALAHPPSDAIFGFIVVERYVGRGRALFALGRYEEALSDFQAAGGGDSNSLHAQMGYIITLHALGKEDEAKRWWKWSTLAHDDEEIYGVDFYDLESLRKELKWAPPLVEEARKLIAKPLAFSC